MLQKCCKIKVSGSLGAYPAPLLEMLSRGRGSKRASLSNQGLSGRTIFYANKSFCEQFNDLPPLITEAALLHTQRSRDLLTTWQVHVEISRPPDGPVLTDPNCHVEKMDLSHLEGFTLGDGACAPLPFLAPREGMKVRKRHWEREVLSRHTNLGASCAGPNSSGYSYWSSLELTLARRRNNGKNTQVPSRAHWVLRTAQSQELESSRV